MQSLGKLKELLRKPTRPTLRGCFGGSFGLVRQILSSPLISLTVAFTAWLYPDAKVKQVLRYSLLFLALAALEAIAAYAWRWWKYLRLNEDLLARVRTTVLKSANVDESGSGNNTFRITALGEEAGSVILVIGTPVNGLKVGSLLSVVVTETDEVWGVVEVASIGTTSARARPVNRIRAEFWERLEDEMKSNPRPPDGVHLEPAIIPEIPKMMRDAMS